MMKFYYANINGRFREIGEIPYRLMRIARSLVSYSEEEFKHPGGMIVCSTDVNSNAGRGIVGWLKGKWETLLNRLFRSKKVRNTITNFKYDDDIYGVGFSQGNLFRGAYYDKKLDKTFNEKSFSIDLRGLPIDVIKKLAVDICKRFNQQSVLIVNHANNRSSLLYP